MQDPRYLTIIDNLESRHIEIIDELIPIDYRPAIELKVKNLFNQLRDVCKGVYSLRELSPYSLDLIMSFGELLSTRIASVKFTSMGISNHWTDAREIIRTVRHGEINTADISKTYSNIRKLLSSEKSRLHIIPGFISSDAQKRTTTLGRGGSDYTASLVAAAAGARVLQIWSDVDGMMTADPMQNASDISLTKRLRSCLTLAQR
jgi:aspartokinase/homoserine dehydrogenase 1